MECGHTAPGAPRSLPPNDLEWWKWRLKQLFPTRLQTTSLGCLSTVSLPPPPPAGQHTEGRKWPGACSPWPRGLGLVPTLPSACPGLLTPRAQKGHLREDRAPLQPQLLRETGQRDLVPVEQMRPFRVDSGRPRALESSGEGARPARPWPFRVHLLPARLPGQGWMRLCPGQGPGRGFCGGLSRASQGRKGSTPRVPPPPRR